MELWASGFNAWGQLELDRSPSSFAHLPDDGYQDFASFRRILADPAIEFMRGSLSSTLIKRSSGQYLSGFPDPFLQFLQSEHRQDDPSLVQIAGNEQVVATKLDTTVCKINTYPSLRAYRESRVLDSTSVGDVVETVANQVAFHALIQGGDVVSWGDPRFPAALGRESTHEDVGRPTVIEDLRGLPTGPIRKISSGGFTTAGLTEGNDLYVWGDVPRPELPRIKLFDELTGVPTAVDVLGHDIHDVAVGEGYIMVLTTDQKLFVTGSNSNGQLGLPNMAHAADWEEVVLPLTQGQSMAYVSAGYKNSFVLVGNP